jgi:hypothetical protein
MAEPFTVTRTNSKRYVGHCSLCDFTTKVISIRANCAIKLRDHARVTHNMTPDTLNKYLEPTKRKGRNMKAPKKDLPALEKFAEYEDHLCVFAKADFGKVKGQFGTSEVDCLVWVYNKAAWKSLGETPIFWQTAGKQILAEIGPESDTPDETLGAFLRKGGNPERNGDFFWLDIAQDKADLALLKSWAKEYADDF